MAAEYDNGKEYENEYKNEVWSVRTSLHPIDFPIDQIPVSMEVWKLPM